MSVIHIFSARKRTKDRFELLLKPHIEGLYRFAYRLCQSQNDAEELVQLLLCKIYPKIDALEKLEKIKPWLARSLYNLYVDTYRKSRREASIFVTGSEHDEHASAGLTPAEHTANTEAGERLHAAIQQLGHDHRIVIMLHDAEGYTLSELENILQTPLGTLKSRLNRARNQLKKKLLPEPFTDDKRDNGEKETIS